MDEGARYCAKCGQVVPASGQTHSPAPTTPTFHYPNNETHSEIHTHRTDGVPTIEFRNLHPNAVVLFFFAFLGRTFILIPLFVITAFVEPLVALIMSVSYIIILVLIAKLLYKNYRFEVTPLAFRKEHGVFHKQTVSIPFEQIQNINVRRSVIDQLLGLAHVDIETAGESGANNKGTIGGLYSPAEGYIPGIAPNEARDLKDLLLSRMQQTR